MDSISDRSVTVDGEESEVKSNDASTCSGLLEEEQDGDDEDDIVMSYYFRISNTSGTTAPKAKAYSSAAHHSIVGARD